MRVLIAEDDPIQRQMLEATLQGFGCEVMVCSNGAEALARLGQEDRPRLAVLDWMMPDIDGLEVCRRVQRGRQGDLPVYVILLTAKTEPEAVVAGLGAGAEDFVSKPFHPGELQARVRVGQRMIQLQETLADRVHELEGALARVKQLQGLLPICAYCKKVRDDRNYWGQVETYLSKHTDVQFTHGICPDCYARVTKGLPDPG